MSLTDEHLTELLERAANRVQVGPAPVPAMVQDAGRARGRRAIGLSLASAAAVAAVAGGTAVLATPSDVPAPLPAASRTPAAIPAGARLVGLGHAAIAVPKEWGTNERRCGVPQQDTVLIDVGITPTCGTSRPRGVDSVEVTQGKSRLDFTADRAMTIDGLPAQRQATTCREDMGGTTVCGGTVHIPSLQVTFRAESSTDAAAIDRILAGIRHVPDRIGVPGYRGSEIANRQERSGETYLAVLRAAGLTAKVRSPQLPEAVPGMVFAVSPQPGTMVRPSAVITVTIPARAF